MVPLPHPCQRPWRLLSVLFKSTFSCWMNWSRPRVAAPPSPGGHLDNLSSLLYRERQTVSGKDPNRVPRAVATQPGRCVAGSDMWGSGTVCWSLRSPNALLVPTGGGASLIVEWRGAKKSSLNSTYNGTTQGKAGAL